mgnify:CR=1 FL=1
MAAPRSEKPCKFCQIVAGSAPSFQVYADDACMAFLDYRPLAIGHVLLVPRRHYGTLAEAPAEVVGMLGARLKPLSAAVMQALEAEGSFIALNNIVSQSIPHVHFHVVPRRRDDRLFSSGLIWKRVSYGSDEDRRAAAAKIRTALAAQNLH